MPHINKLSILKSTILPNFYVFRLGDLHLGCGGRNCVLVLHNRHFEVSRCLAQRHSTLVLLQCMQCNVYDLLGAARGIVNMFC